MSNEASNRSIIELRKAANGTCRWLVEHETLIQWTHQNRGLLWIKGKPGSGKSTMMKYALRELPAHYGPDTQAFDFFFHGRAWRTPLGLFRSLLHQLLSCMPGALFDLVDDFDAKRKSVGEPGEKWQWHLQTLQKYFESALLRILKRFPVILFIDALDECGRQPALELIQYLRWKLSCLPPSDFKFGICFSCRHCPILELDGGLTVILESENQQDIATFVEAHISTSHLDTEVGKLIIQHAQGVFMWARLVLRQVLLLDHDGAPTAEIIAEIERIREDLNGVYIELVKAVTHRSTTFKLMRWICFSTRPLTTEELQWAMVADPVGAWTSLDECRASKDFIQDNKIDRRINSLSSGLVEIIPSQGAHIVQFIHQSVKDFLTEEGLWALNGMTGVAHELVSTSHCLLSQACLYYLKMDVHSQGQAFSEADTSKFPFARYAVESWVSHVKLGEPPNSSPELSQFARMARGIRTLRILSCLLVDLVDEVGEANGHEGVIQVLLDTGKVEVDSKDKEGRTPLSWASENGQEGVVQMVLDTGKVDVAAEDVRGLTALQVAGFNGHSGTEEMLIARGAPTGETVVLS
ncbi:hypothetical protein BGZ61DRAFT_500637 [Ilyonectria robusta]|uniref:uncharacterized protein n=1 Tax=Ilyonectria robusta TaxID=1079257 RepID=UPI001E8ED751|nr:uncharacterized protein BGZ61DRAFT_500637 [Ilyonectria robusta]KAH8654201.1 hypothetical protein BGZ61DRAFT_500637 [Ilyonectria robusta]